MWATGEEAAGDHRVELNRLHVLNPFAEGQRRAEGAGTKCTRCPKWNTRWQEVGRRPLKTTPGPLPRWDGLCDRSGQRWQGGRPGAPPHSTLTPPREPADLLWARRGATSARAQDHYSQSTGCILTSRQILTTVWCTTSSTASHQRSLGRISAALRQFIPQNND